MSDPVTAFLFFLSLLGRGEQGPPRPGPDMPPPPPPPPSPMPPPAPGEVIAPPLVVDVPPPPAAPPMPPWAGPVTPSALPPFPGPGWVYDEPVSAAVVARAQYWNPKLWNYAQKRIVSPFVQEQFGGRWLTFKAAWHPGDKGPQTFMSTEAFRLASAAPIAPAPQPPPPQAPPLAVIPPGPPVPPASPMPQAPLPEAPPAPFAVPASVVVPPADVPVVAPVSPPPPIPPYPGPGAYKTNSPYILAYQKVLAYLAARDKHPAWSPGGLDGKYGALTAAAVKAFQASNGIAPQDGAMGSGTEAVANALLTGQAAPPMPAAVVVPPPMTPPVVPAVLVQPAAGAPPSPMPMAIPAQVSPYPGTGAYKSNAAYIRRYQAALTYLAQALGHPPWDPGGIDGKYGPKTASAVSAFETANGLGAPDGAAGPAVAARLDALLAGARAGQSA